VRFRVLGFGLSGAVRGLREPRGHEALEVANAPAMTDHDGDMVHFCSDRCRVKFETNQERYRPKLRSATPRLDLSYRSASKVFVQSPAVVGLSWD
jgi:hypothetical protein